MLAQPCSTRLHYIIQASLKFIFSPFVAMIKYRNKRNLREKRFGSQLQMQSVVAEESQRQGLGACRALNEETGGCIFMLSSLALPCVTFEYYMCAYLQAQAVVYQRRSEDSLLGLTFYYHVGS